MIERICAHCGHTFARPRRRGTVPKYCTPLCNDRATATRQRLDGRREARNAARRKTPTPLEDPS